MDRNRTDESIKFRDEVVTGLRESPKRLPCKYFYDQRGSGLFDRICELDEYYLTRSELKIMEEFAPQMGAAVGPRGVIVEYGSGSSIKTRFLLDALEEPVAYVPVDISEEHLRATARELARDYPHVEVLPVSADFTEGFALPAVARDAEHVCVYFPGSTIGNFLPGDASRLLCQIASQCGRSGHLLIGIDLQKNPKKIEAAYNDRLGVTAEFNLNLLARINRELDADFNLDQFSHQARYRAKAGRVEMYLVSRRKQVVSIGEEVFHFAAGEGICTEYSHKYTVTQFIELAGAAGLSFCRHWTDAERNFAVLLLSVAQNG